ncbi:MAG: GNAT family N-acetyltransferase [Opitutaceae bacterium]|jgi:predicted GNAT family N-acyltransferase
MPYRFEPLDSARHDRAGFCCTSAALTAYLQKQARKDAERHLAATFVMIEDAHPSRIVGYYTLSNYTVELAALPEELARRLPRYPRLPATLLGRLARARDFPGTGQLLLMDALLRAYAQARGSGSIAVVAEAKDECALAFYRKYGFLQLGAQGNRVFLSMRVIGRLFAPSG